MKDGDARTRRLLYRLGGLRIDRFTSFLQVIEQGGFSAAAQAIDLPQPTISRHVAELERSLGVRLFTRSSHAVTLTEEGQVLAEHVRAAMRELEQAGEHLEESQDTVAGTVLIGMYPSAATLLYPRLLSSLAQVWPHIRLVLWEGAPYELSEAISSNDVDLAIRPDLPPARSSGLHHAPLWREPLVLVVPDHDELLGQRRPVQLRMIENRPVITIGNSASRAGLDPETDLAFTAAGLEPDVVMRTDAPQLLAAMVAHGHGVGVTNALAMRSANLRGVHVITVSEEDGGREVGLWWNGARNRLRRSVRVTAEHIEQTVPEAAFDRS